MVYSADGRNWRSATLPAVAKALPGRPIVPGSLTAFEGGFVVVGRDGSPDPYSQVVDSPLPPAMGRPAAWFSPNGIDWAKAEVPGQMVPGGELREVAAGANGLFAVGIGEAVDTQTHPVTHGWASKDGMTWTLVGRVGVDLPFIGGRLLAQGFLVGDGATMAIFGATSATSAAAVASMSVDGVEWQPLKFSGTQTDFLVGTWNQAGPQGHHYLTRATVVPGGVIAQVFSGQPEFWFGTGVTDGE